MFGTVIWILAGVALAFVIWRVGVGMLRSVTTPLPEPPPSGELRKVNLRYRCSTCGMEIKLLVANDELPDPPKHCMEEMDVVAPPIE